MLFRRPSVRQAHFGRLRKSPPYFTSVSQILNLIKHHGIPKENSSSAVPRGLHHPRRSRASPRSTKPSVSKQDRNLRGVVFFAVSLKDKIDPQIRSAHRSQARPGPWKLRHPMKAGMIFARKSTWRSRLDLEYLDETSSRKVSLRQQHDDGAQMNQEVQALHRLRLEGNARPGSRGRIPAPSDSAQRGRQQHRTRAA